MTRSKEPPQWTKEAAKEIWLALNRPETYDRSVTAVARMIAAHCPSQAPASTERLRKIQPIVCCPKRGAKTQDDAEIVCNATDDDCPMTCEFDWIEAMVHLNREQIFVEIEYPSEAGAASPARTEKET